jgi:hypothetical protein
MLKPRDNFGPDAVALPRRNIFAPPAGKPSPKAPRSGGVFDAGAACRDGVAVGSGGDVGAAVAIQTSGRVRFGRFAPILAVVLAAATAALLFVSADSREGTHADPSTHPRDVSPAQTLGERARPPATRTVHARKPAPRRRRHRASRPRPRRVPRHRVAPVPPRSATPSPKQSVPQRRAAPHPPSARTRPARVPAGSPPEFL